MWVGDSFTSSAVAIVDIGFLFSTKDTEKPSGHSPAARDADVRFFMFSYSFCYKN